MDVLTGDAYLLVNQFLIVMGSAFLVTGLSLLLFPDKTLEIIRQLNVWVDTDRWFDYLNTELKSEAFIYRHHRIFGTFILLASLWIFWVFVVSHPSDDFQFLGVFELSDTVDAWLTGSIIFLIRLVSVFFIITGLVVLIRPSLLKMLEQKMNRWIDTDVSGSLETPHKGADEYLVQHPRLIGGFVLCAGAYLVLSAAVMLSS